MAEKTPKYHKTIFHTTEKSNFILNMTHEQFNKFSSTVIIIGLFLLFISSAVAEIIALMTTGNFFEYSSAENGDIYDPTGFIFDWRILPSFGLAALGLLSICIFIIAVIKQTLTKKQIIPAVIAGIMFIFLYISSLNSFTGVEDYSWFIGYRYGRYEGFMTYISLLFVFLGALSVNDKSALKKIIDGIMLIAALQCIWGGLQAVPSFPDFYKNLLYAGKVGLFIPSGSTGSPVFFATLLSSALSLAVAGALFDSNKKRSAIYNIAIVPFAFLLVKTHTLIGIISAIFIFIISLICAMVYNKKNSEKISFTPLILLVTGIASALAMMYINGFELYDGEIIWQDGSRRLDSFGKYTGEEFDIHDITSIYPYLWARAVMFIQKFPLLGLGPDAFILPQMDFAYSMGFKLDMTFDRPYNDYLLYAALFGIPFAAFYAVLILNSVINSIRTEKTAKGKENWIFFGIMTAVIVYVPVSFITNTTSSTAPFIWLLLGLSCCSTAEN